MPKRRFKKSTVAVAAAIIILFVAAAVTALIFFVGSRNTPAADGQAVVYKKSDGVYLSASGETVKITLSDDSDVLITSDNKFLIYTTSSAKVSKKYDIYACEISSSSGVKKGPALLDYGVEKSFDYNANKLYYSKQNTENLAVTTYLYNLNSGKKTDIDFALDDIFIPSQGDTIFYTKKFVDSKALYSYSSQSGSREIIKPVADVHFYDDETSSELLFETGSYNEGESELYRVIPGENPVQIATMVSSVMYDNYTPGGNLYYFTKKETPADWRGIIEDDMEESDSLFAEPDKKDYTFIFGISIQYRLDMERYQKKLMRDSIREYLDNEVSEDVFSESYNLYVINDAVTQKIAEGVEEKNVFAVALKGEPRVIFTSTKISSSSVKMSDLSEMLDNSNIDDIKKYIDEILAECVKKSGVLFVGSSVGEPVELTAYREKKAEFIFPEDSSVFYVSVADEALGYMTVYKHSVSNGNVSQPEQIDSNVLTLRLAGDELWYQKSNGSVSSGDLFRYVQNESQKIEENVSSFSVSDSTGIIIYKNFVSENGEETADIIYWNGKKACEVSADADVSGLICKTSGVAFLRNVKKNGGELCIYSKNKLAVIDRDVYNIIAY